MNFTSSLIATCIIAFSPAVLAQQDSTFSFVDDSNSILIAENRSGSSNEMRGPQFRSHSMEDKGMVEAYEDDKMDQEMKNSVDSQGFERERIHNKRV